MAHNPMDSFGCASPDHRLCTSYPQAVLLDLNGHGRKNAEEAIALSAFGWFEVVAATEKLHLEFLLTYDIFENDGADSADDDEMMALSVTIEARKRLP